jgi:predicted dehydrogenase
MIKIGVIGYGYWGPNLVRNFNEAPGVSVVAVSDLSPARLALMNTRHPTIKATQDHFELLSDPTIDAIVIATPVSTHFDLALQSLRAGKHVLVEKPLAPSSEQGERLIEEAQRRRLVLMVDHTFVYTGAVRKIKELVGEGRLGTLYYYDSVRVNLGLFQHDVNVLWDLAVHDLSIMDFVLPEKPTAVSATGIAHLPGHPKDVAYMTCFFESNFIAHFHVNWLAPVKVRRTLIGGDRQMIVYDDIEPSEKIKVYDIGVYSSGADGRYQLMVGYRTGDMWAPQLDTMEGLQVEARHFIECIEKNKQPITDGAVGLRLVRLLEAATVSMSQKGRVMEIYSQGIHA